MTINQGPCGIFKKSLYETHCNSLTGKQWIFMSYGTVYFFLAVGLMSGRSSTFATGKDKATIFNSNILRNQQKHT